MVLVRYIPPFQGWFLPIPDTQGVALGWYILPLRGVSQTTFIYHSLACRSTTRWPILAASTTDPKGAITLGDRSTIVIDNLHL